MMMQVTHLRQRFHEKAQEVKHLGGDCRYNSRHVTVAATQALCHPQASKNIDLQDCQPSIAVWSTDVCCLGFCQPWFHIYR
jgi:hypothetical protein